MAKGRRYENQLVNGVWDHDSETVAYPMGYSGSNAVPSADVIVIDNGNVAAIEVKKTSGDYISFDGDDIRQILHLGTETEMYAGLLVKFAHREPYLTPLNWESEIKNRMELTRLFPKYFDARVTGSGVLRITQPSLDHVRSAQSGRSGAELIVEKMSQIPSRHPLGEDEKYGDYYGVEDCIAES